MTKKQKILTILIVIVTLLFVGTLIFGGGNGQVDKAECLDRGDVWDERRDRCYSSQANNFPQSYTAACREGDKFTLTLFADDSAQLINRRFEPAAISLSADQGRQWEYTAADGQTKLALSGQTARIRTSEQTFENCELKSLAPATPTGAHTAGLGVGETTRAGEVTITLQEVVQDSRCPADVVCIEGGGITVGVKLFSQGLIRDVNISSDSAPYEFGRHDISIPHVEPPRVSGQDPAQDEYRVTFQVSTTTPTNS